MSRLLVIGCGGVAQVAISKVCQAEDTFKEVMIASRTKSKCDDLKAALEGKTSVKIETAQVDADKVEEVIALIVFLIFSFLFFKNETFRWNHFVGLTFLVLAVYFIFKK